MENQNYRNRGQIGDCQREGFTTKGQCEGVWGRCIDRTVLFLNCGPGYMILPICEN